VSVLDIEIRDAMVASLCPGTLGLDELGKEVQKVFSGLEAGSGNTQIGPTSTLAQNALQDPQPPSRVAGAPFGSFLFVPGSQ
jgi:hypothetical protein